MTYRGFIALKRILRNVLSSNLFARANQVRQHFIDSYEAVIQLKDNDIISFDGKWCFLNDFEQNKEPYYDTVNIMFIEKNNVIENQNQSSEDIYRVKRLEQCYKAIITPDNRIYLIPSVKIDYENGKSSLVEIIKND